jgi:L-type amino acid transporter 6
LQIGAGIFSAPSQISTYVPSAGIALVLWFVGGLAVWTGAACFIELGTRIPRNGGMMEYLVECYGDFAGCLFAWVWLFVAKPSSLAVTSGVFANHFVGAIFPTTERMMTVEKCFAILALSSITILNFFGTMSGATTANWFLGFKILATISIMILGTYAGLAGIARGTSGSEWFAVTPLSTPTDSLWDSIGAYVTALFGILYCYGGWESVSNISITTLTGRLVSWPEKLVSHFGHFPTSSMSR